MDNTLYDDYAVHLNSLQQPVQLDWEVGPGVQDLRSSDSQFCVYSLPPHMFASVWEATESTHETSAAAEWGLVAEHWGQGSRAQDCIWAVSRWTVLEAILLDRELFYPGLSLPVGALETLQGWSSTGCPPHLPSTVPWPAAGSWWGRPSASLTLMPSRTNQNKNRLSMPSPITWVFV